MGPPMRGIVFWMLLFHSAEFVIVREVRIFKEIGAAVRRSNEEVQLENRNTLIHYNHMYKYNLNDSIVNGNCTHLIQQWDRAVNQLKQRIKDHIVLKDFKPTSESIFDMKDKGEPRKTMDGKTMIEPRKYDIENNERTGTTIEPTTKKPTKPPKTKSVTLGRKTIFQGFRGFTAPSTSSKAESWETTTTTTRSPPTSSYTYDEEEQEEDDLMENEEYADYFDTRKKGKFWQAF